MCFKGLAVLLSNFPIYILSVLRGIRGAQTIADAVVP